MKEFLNRVEVQRTVLTLINSKGFRFPIVGLAKPTIERWQIENSIEKDSKILKLIIEISGQLFFLSNRSQEQITEDYKNKSEEISGLIEVLKAELQMTIFH